MNDRNDPVIRFLADLDPAKPPEELRARALERALQAWEHPGAPDCWRRIWESRPLRLAWAAAVIALVAANLAAPSRTGRSSVSANASPAAAPSPDLQDAVHLPRLRLSYVGLDGEAASPQTAPDSSSVRTLLEKETRS